MKGMESEGVLSSAKHFPGHGDTATDSHHALPIIDFSRKRLDSIELYPYQKLINEGLSSVMVAHLEVPALEMKKNQKDSIFRNPDAISLAPICSGIRRLLKVPLSPAVSTKNTMTVP